MLRSDNAKLEKIIHSYIPKNTRCRFDEQKRQVLREKEKSRILSAIEKVNMVSVEVTNEWEQQPPDMSVCSACKETIYGNQYSMIYKLNGEPVEQGRPIVLCEPCYLKNK